MIINLVRPELSELKFKVNSFPDGQRDVVIEKSEEMLRSMRFTNLPATIVSRLNSFSDLELVICATQALRNLLVKEIHLEIPYLLGARSDRKFVQGGTSYLRDVLFPILRVQCYESITTWDVHNPDVVSALFRRFESRSNLTLVEMAIEDIVKYHEIPFRHIAIVSPDAGSMKKIYAVTDGIGYKDDVIICSKNRDTSGRLSRTTVPVNESHDGKAFVIIDDICDGGRTFINIAQELPKESKKFLIVTHGIFSGGFEELSKHFTGIYCTNSYKDLEEGVWLNDETWYRTKQLKVI